MDLSATPSRSTDSPEATGERGWRHALGWGIYVGMSWTWCIGMFLPVLLVRELGFWGWVVFAVPNVVGAAAMGWVLRTAEDSRRIVEDHPHACLAFTWVTIAFHGFFLMWIVFRILGGWAAAPMILAIFLFRIIRQRYAMTHGVALATLSISLWTWASALFETNELRFPSVAAPDTVGLLALAPVCLFGFLLCPYLDVTFHRARQETNRADARVAFGLGFGVFFLAMIVFSLMYAQRLAPLVDLQGRIVRSRALLFMAVHVGVQTAFTLLVHFEESLAVMSEQTRKWRIMVVVGVVLSALVGGTADSIAAGGSRWFGLDPGEVVYRTFMGFYGLGFPAYVWICMVPKGRRQTQLTVFGVAVLLALPFYFAGFILRHLVWLLPGVAIPVVAGLVMILVSRRQVAR